MELFKNYEIRKLNTENNEYELILRLDNQLTEFAVELGKKPSESKDYLTIARQIVKDRYPGIKVTMVRVIVGGLAVSVMPFMADSKEAKAAGTSDQTTEEAQSYSMFYSVAPGDTLWVISKKFNTSVADIKKANDLTSDIIKVNQQLMIPKAFHTVGTGDYLSVLAKKYGTTVNAIKYANHLASDSTRLGQVLIIPLLISDNETRSTEPVQPPASKEQTEEKEATKYTVVSGDSLSEIAKRFGITTEALKEANALTSDVIRVGQTLTIPNAKTETPQAPTPIARPSSYTVVSGDSLSEIAKRFGTTTESLKEANALTSDVIRIGQKLTIPNAKTETPQAPTPIVRPSSYTVVSGDSLSVIAKKFDLSIDTIRKANHLTTDIIRVGQVLEIPEKDLQVKEEPSVVEKAPGSEENRKTFDYSVRSGDNLSVIAKRFSVTVDNIRDENQLKTDTVYVGQILTIPNGLHAPTETGVNTITYKTHTVVSGDNIWNLSVQYGIPQAELLRANNLTESSRLSLGQKLKIPVHNIAVKDVVSAKHGEYLDWFTEAQYVFPIGKTAKVTDMGTGKSFKIKRTIGANHADSETLTVADSNMAKSIWGGFSWKTRAVIVEVDGRRLAASMSFMPHEQDYIADNGITGHFDVYFGNSIRHIDGRPDPAHQAQVEKAAGIR
ncbi:LysM peptidoglycan-binding domain-containing protein [Bacillus massilinigeriensis]|uniref:LysM peptidoglycan-binding domain-containing protein n=1 Tax=Bacillus massilionigeriensis TaxID=1805475 RepID=UPI000A069412|nr:LysM peptidoglycan-binding domain-containing protein [Bacillus massilionigeriensis]